MLVDNVSKKKYYNDGNKKCHDNEIHKILLLNNKNSEAIMVMGQTQN